MRASAEPLPFEEGRLGTSKKETNRREIGTHPLSYLEKRDKMRAACGGKGSSPLARGKGTRLKGLNQLQRKKKKCALTYLIECQAERRKGPFKEESPFHDEGNPIYRERKGTKGGGKEGRRLSSYFLCSSCSRSKGGSALVCLMEGGITKRSELSLTLIWRGRDGLSASERRKKGALEQRRPYPENIPGGEKRAGTLRGLSFFLGWITKK